MVTRMTPPGTAYPGPVGAEGRSLQSWAGAAGGRGQAQGLPAKEVLLRQVRAQLARRQGGRLSGQALDKVTARAGRTGASGHLPRLGGGGALHSKNEEVRVTHSFPRRGLTLCGIRHISADTAVFPRAGRR